MLRELTASQLVAIATGSDTGSHNRLDLIPNLVPTHYVCNWYISNNAIRQTFIQRKLLKTACEVKYSEKVSFHQSIYDTSQGNTTTRSSRCEPKTQ